jgi:hypothetical protein
VAGKGTNNVVVVSPGGKNCREILTQRDGLNKPYSLIAYQELATVNVDT